MQIAIKKLTKLVRNKLYSNILVISFFFLPLSACIVVPEKDPDYVAKCEISEDKKVLKVIDLYEETNSFYDISGIFLLPITGAISGLFVAVNNTYILGKEKIVCK